MALWLVATAPNFVLKLPLVDESNAISGRLMKHCPFDAMWDAM